MRKFFVATIQLLILLCTIDARALVVNVDDKSEKYKLKSGALEVGQVEVDSKFVEESVLTPVRIRVVVKCATGHSLSGFKNPADWAAYDYGQNNERTLLSKFDEAKQELTVFFIKIIEDDSKDAPTLKESSRVFKLAGVCRKN